MVCWIFSVTNENTRDIATFSRDMLHSTMMKMGLKEQDFWTQKWGPIGWGIPLRRAWRTVHVKTFCRWQTRHRVLFLGASLCFPKLRSMSSGILSIPTCQVFDNLCSSKKETQGHGLPGLTCWPDAWYWHMRPPTSGSHPMLFLERQTGGTCTLWILITCGWVSRFLIRFSAQPLLLEVSPRRKDLKQLCQRL